MKQLTCDMCGGTDLIKQDGMFICQTCGTKYSVEEAKKLMIDGLVDVSGSIVKIDTSDDLVNLYKIARRAKDDNNGENAASGIRNIRAGRHTLCKARRECSVAHATQKEPDTDYTLVACHRE